MIQINGITKSFGNHRALDNISLHVAKGTIFGLLGPNGAGKTTLIRILNHILTPDCGDVTFDGHPLTDNDMRHIGYMPEERGLYKKMRVGELALYLARLKGMDKQESEQALDLWLERLGIGEWRNKRIETLSKGMQQKVQFLATVMHSPKLLILDEPFSGFDPVNAEAFKQEILRLKEQGTTIIISTHNMQSADELCDSIALIDHAQIVLSGTLKDIKSAHSNNDLNKIFISTVKQQ